MLKSLHQRSGLTLVELLITIALISVLAATAIPIAKISVKREKEIGLRRSLRLIRDAIDAYKKLSDAGKIETEDEFYGYPPDLETLVTGVEIKEEKDGEEETKLVKFLRRIPKDPMTESLEWGLRSYQDEFGSGSWGGENVYDVYTRSWGIAIDGSKYKEW